MTNTANKNNNENDSINKMLEYLKVTTPYEREVNGQYLAAEIECIFKKYVHLPLWAPTALTLWTLHTYAFDKFDYTPRLVIHSPEPRCGKTTLLSLLNELCCKSLSTTSTTAAAIFRLIDMFKPTILIDEADTFLKTNEDLRMVLNSGFQASSGKIARMVDKNPCPTLFDCYAPCAIASIGTIQQTIMDRAIIIPMERSNPEERPLKLRMKTIESQLEIIRQKCTKFMENISYNEGVQIPKELNSRQQDIWEPLLIIAEAISPNYADRARKAAVALAASGITDNETTRLSLLSDIREIFQNEECDAIGSQDLCIKLLGFEERPWGTISKGKAINPCFLASQLKFFGIQSEKHNYGKTTKRLYIREHFQEAFRRYLPNRQPAENKPTAPKPSADLNTSQAVK